MAATSPAPAYAHLRPGTIARTVEAGSVSVMADLDADGRILGVETLDGSDWTQALVTLAMQGRLAVVPAPED